MKISQNVRSVSFSSGMTDLGLHLVE